MRKKYRRNSNFSRQLNKILDDVFTIAWKRDWSWGDLARFSGVSYNTVEKIGDRKSKYPQFRTVEALCNSVNLTLRTVRGRVEAIPL